MTDPVTDRETASVEPPAARRALRIIWGLSLALAGVSLLGFSERLWWGFDVFSHFRAHYEVAGLLIALYALVSKAWRSLALLGVLFVLNGWPLLGLLGGAPAAPQGAGAPIRVATLNVQMDAPHGKALAWLQATDADLVALQEVDAPWMTGIAQAGARWPHHVARPRGAFLGLALLSRWPIEAQGPLRVGEGEADVMLWARVAAPGGPLDVVVAHPLPPMNDFLWHQRNGAIQGLADQLDRFGPRLLVAGDFNAAPWSAALAPLRDAGLTHGRVGRGLQPSWPAAWPMLGVPIDHVFVRGLTVVRHQVGPALDGDHLPVLVDVVPGPGLATQVGRR